MLVIHVSTQNTPTNLHSSKSILTTATQLILMSMYILYHSLLTGNEEDLESGSTDSGLRSGVVAEEIETHDRRRGVPTLLEDSLGTEEEALRGWTGCNSSSVPCCC